ncbi:MAG: hypothetical protein IAX22_04835 [Candidatus Bathyarchaeota archaeon]|nr:hypothetical protein [Candidatus Bathyarchaeota archaeon]
MFIAQKPNFSRDFTNWAVDQFGQIDPIFLFGYIYSVLYSRTYRVKYNSALRTSYPRIPITSNKDLFKKISLIGKELIDLHLLKNPKIHDSIAGFPEIGSDMVNLISFDSNKAIVKINETQFFTKINQDIWDFEVGGYRICEKWLKNRLGRTLESDDQAFFMKLVGSIKETLNLQKEIDRLYPSIEANLATFSFDIKKNTP